MNGYGEDKLLGTILINYYGNRIASEEEEIFSFIFFLNINIDLKVNIKYKFFASNSNYIKKSRIRIVIF
jgi:hypothetical protein